MTRTFVAIVSAASFIGAATGAAAQSYDIDCKVILCMAGGFPAGCGDAYSYMIDRITDFPKPKPPFGVCKTSDGSSYKGADASYAYLRRDDPNGWVCPDTHMMKFNPGDDKNSNTGSAFCYTSISTRRVGDEIQTTYNGRLPADNVNFQVQVSIDKGTQSEFTSPVYRMNYKTGFIAPTVGE